jgi:hypothetical protein
MAHPCEHMLEGQLDSLSTNILQALLRWHRWDIVVHSIELLNNKTWVVFILLVLLFILCQESIHVRVTFDAFVNFD